MNVIGQSSTTEKTMKIKLLDTLHLSELGRDARVKGDIVDIGETAAKSLIERKLAIKVEGNPKRKAKRAAANKAAPRLRNQASTAAKNKSSR